MATNTVVLQKTPRRITTEVSVIRRWPTQCKRFALSVSHVTLGDHLPAKVKTVKLSRKTGRPIKAIVHNPAKYQDRWRAERLDPAGRCVEILCDSVSRSVALRELAKALKG